MWKEHSHFEDPPTGTKIWRYMDFTKFIDLLETQSLYFSRPDKFGDPFEGSYPQFNVDNRSKRYGDTMPPEIIAMLTPMNENFRNTVALNCWHMNEFESAAMWKLYLKSDEGIAVCSTFGSLTECFADHEEDVYTGIVKYIDYEREWMPEGNMLYPFFHKRKSFEHERELRAVICRWPKADDGGFDDFRPTIDHGVRVPVQIETLLHSVYVAPGAPEWTVNLAKSVVRRYGLTVPVCSSALLGSPVY